MKCSSKDVRLPPELWGRFLSHCARRDDHIKADIILSQHRNREEECGIIYVAVFVVGGRESAIRTLTKLTEDVGCLRGYVTDSKREQYDNSQ